MATVMMTIYLVKYAILLSRTKAVLLQDSRNAAQMETVYRLAFLSISVSVMLYVASLMTAVRM